MNHKPTLTQSWRWFGPEDPVTLQDIKQAGATSIVSSLHHIPNGDVWTQEEIRKRLDVIQKAGFTWGVVESLPVHEAIKLGTADRDSYMENYIQSLENLASEGLNHIVYNFMALTDWTRTDLYYEDSDGALTISYNHAEIAMFDLFILERTGASADYSEALKQHAAFLYDSLANKEKDRITKTILMGLPGTVEDLSLEVFKQKLEAYRALGKDGLRENFVYFLKSVLPVAEKLKITLSIHPDDPPFTIFGLPRMVSVAEDLAFILKTFPSDSNAITLCTGTFGANPKNKVTEIIDRFADRISFYHLRNVKLEANHCFFESKLFEGSLNMTEIASKILKEQERRGMNDFIPYRPDHGQAILSDPSRNTYPGYPAIGRLKALAELRGLFEGLNYR
ncbi:mannonate dehydratase [Bacteroidota bacterium]